MKRLINIISSIILLILILIIIVIFAPKLFSIEPMVVVSGSMEPSYMKGSLLYVKESAHESCLKVPHASLHYAPPQALRHQDNL